jgi:hypothetical protein
MFLLALRQHGPAALRFARVQQCPFQPRPPGEFMKKRCAFIAGSALVATGVGGTPAMAQPIDKGHFHNVFTNEFSCNGTPVQVSGDVSGNFVFNQRGSSADPYYRESSRGTLVFTNLNTGGTYTRMFTSNGNDKNIVDNGDGTITLTGSNAGSTRFRDQNGKLVVKDSGTFRFTVVINTNGTPLDTSDDTFVEGSFQIVKDSTRVDSESNFCADLVMFTT